MYPEYKYSKNFYPFPNALLTNLMIAKCSGLTFTRRRPWVTQGPVLRGFMVQNPAVATLKFLIIFEHKVLIFILHQVLQIM